MVKNLLSNGGDMSSIPGQGTKISHAMRKLKPHATTTESTCSGAHVPDTKIPHDKRKTLSSVQSLCHVQLLATP